MFNSDYDIDQPERGRTTAIFKPDSLKDGVLVPGLQAAITGVVCGVAAGAITAWFALPWPAIGATAAAVATCGAWLAYRGRWAWTLERLLGVDLNGDQTIGQPLPQLEREPERITVQLIEDGNHQQFIDLPYAERLPQLASSVLAGRQFSQALYCGNGQLFTRAQFENLRAELLRRGLLTWRNSAAPAQGCELTASGRAIFRRLAALPPAGRNDQ